VWRNRDQFITGRAQIDVPISPADRRIFGPRGDAERGQSAPLH
jgi:hypothetical protein